MVIQVHVYSGESGYPLEWILSSIDLRASYFTRNYLLSIFLPRSIVALAVLFLLGARRRA
jgi:hypothetical protein